MIVDRDNVYHNIEFTKLFQTILDSVRFRPSVTAD